MCKMEKEEFEKNFKKELAESLPGRGVSIIFECGYLIADDFSFVDFVELPNKPHIRLYENKRWVGVLDLKSIVKVGAGWKVTKKELERREADEKW